MTEFGADVGESIGPGLARRCTRMTEFGPDVGEGIGPDVGEGIGPGWARRWRRHWVRLSRDQTLCQDVEDGIVPG